MPKPKDTERIRGLPHPGSPGNFIFAIFAENVPVADARTLMFIEDSLKAELQRVPLRG